MGEENGFRFSSEYMDGELEARMMQVQEKSRHSVMRQGKGMSIRVTWMFYSHLHMAMCRD